MTSLIFTSCCSYCNQRGEAVRVVKMAASMESVETEITSIDAEENKAYNIKVNVEDAKKAENGKNFFFS